MESGLYLGTLRHRRFSPARHEFTYPLFLAFLDIDRIAELMRISPFAAHNRWAWASFYDADHFGNLALPFRRRLEDDARQHYVTPPSGQVFLLTHLRYLGYNFNPVSFFYCYNQQGAFDRVLAEVNNTFGETQNYWLTPAVERPAGENRKYRFPKSFHVSPFMPLNHEYEWTFTPPGDRLVVESINYENGQMLFDSTLKLERHDWSRRELHRALLRFPCITAKIVAGIHWQALRLLLKRVRIVSHPGPGRFEPVQTPHLGAAWKND
jgi:hypothetical protein